ncbi:MAG: cytochrome b N-terminal domain-containing protein [Gemmatimonadota bacterium]|nr:MAG: cytochrome b N-terminal domain-containing protein [Gemmatimonadota bacterium]
MAHNTEPGRGTHGRGLASRIVRSIFSGPVYPRDDRERKWVVFNHLILHFRPVRLPQKTLKYTHTWGLGGMSFVLFLLLVVTGIMLMFVYEPSAEGAYESIVRMQQEVFFGKLVRNVHHWSANLLIAIVVLHLLRVYFTGGYRTPREFNWIIGLLLLACVLTSNFTGYLLPWDQLSYWAITISTGMISYVPVMGDWLREVARDGPEIGQATLINFYTLHTTVVPVLLILLMAWHFWRVRRARGVVVPRSAAEPPDDGAHDRPQYALTLPDLLFRESVVALCLIAFILVVSLFFNAPLDEAANPGMSPNPAKAPWYFVGIQELLLHFHPFFAVVVIPLLGITALLAIPYLRYSDDTAGIWFMSHRGRRTAIIAATTALILTPVMIVADEFWLSRTALLPGVPSVVSNGLLPAAVLGAALVGFYRVSQWKWGASRDEAVQASFVLLTVAFLILTATGVWFRGPGMGLDWP